MLKQFSDWEKFEQVSNQISTNKTEQSSLLSGNYSVYGFEIKLTRSIGPFILSVYLPSAMFVTMSWVSFFIPPVREGFIIFSINWRGFFSPGLKWDPFWVDWELLYVFWPRKNWRGWSFSEENIMNPSLRMIKKCCCISYCLSRMLFQPELSCWSLCVLSW